MQDLFGEVPPQQHTVTGRKTARAKGYYAPPGTGPADHTCGDCRHHVLKRMSKTYHKCDRARGKWTGGRASDILVRSPACSGWEPTLQTDKVKHD